MNTLKNTAYINCDFEFVVKWLKGNLTEEKYSHSLGTMECAGELAGFFNLDREKAQIAGLVHDCAKNIPFEQSLRMLQEENTELSEDELKTEKTLHAPMSALMARKKFGIKDEEILSGIRWHTLGKADMSDFEKIIFIADKIEKNTRDEALRAKVYDVLFADNGLNLALLLLYKRTINHLLDRQSFICSDIINIYNGLLKFTNP